jgi:hypothetical protein
MLSSGTFIVICFIVIVFVGNWYYVSYTSPKDIDYTYNGIKYHRDKNRPEEQIQVKIKGQYKRSIFGDSDTFKGSITIGEDLFNSSDCYLALNKDRMASLDQSASSGFGHYGMIFISNMFKEMVIEVHEETSNRVYSSNGWFIAAPCDERSKAVEITNELMEKTYGKQKIDE